MSLSSPAGQLPWRMASTRRFFARACLLTSSVCCRSPHIVPALRMAALALSSAFPSQYPAANSSAARRARAADASPITWRRNALAAGRFDSRLARGAPQDSAQMRRACFARSMSSVGVLVLADSRAIRSSDCGLNPRHSPRTRLNLLKYCSTPHVDAMYAANLRNKGKIAAMG